MFKKALIATCGLILLAGVFMAGTAIGAEILVEKDTVTTRSAQVSFVKTADNFIVMYDSSSSMADKYAGSEMIELDAELEILKEKNQSLPDLKWQAGIYTHTPGVETTKYFAIYLPMQTYDKAVFATSAIKGAALKTFRPNPAAGRFKRT